MFETGPGKLRGFALRTVVDVNRPAAKRVLRAFPGTGRRLSFESLAELAGTDDVVLNLEGISPVSPGSFGLSVAVAIAGRKGAVRGVLLLENDGAVALARAALGRPGEKNRSLTSGENGALLYALDRAGGDWIDAGGVPFEIKGLLAGENQIPQYMGTSPCHCFKGNVRFGNTAFQVALILSSEVDKYLPQMVGPSLEPDAGAKLPLVFYAVLGRAVLPRGQVEELGRGDVLEFDPVVPLRRLRGEGSPVLLTNGGLGIHCSWVDRWSLQLLSMPPWRSDMSGEHSKGFGREPVVAKEAVADLDVEVRVEVGSVRARLEEVLSWVPGELVSLGRPVSGDVSLTVGERVVARGELVNHEDRLAVEIKETK